MSQWFNRENSAGKVLVEWWKRLESDRASRAILRRSSTITAVALSPPYQRLYRRLRDVGWGNQATPNQDDRLAAAAGLLAHVSQDDGRTPAVAMSSRSAREGHPAADRPPVSELRFLRLLESPDLDALFSGLRRVLPLMNHSVDVITLTNDVVYWGDKVKKRWAYDYQWPEQSGK